jgi:hypothetical protein
MEKIKSSIKCLIIIFTLILMQTFSFAQTKLADLKDGSISTATTQSYHIKITNKKINIDNINNKFTEIKQNSPRLYGQVLTKPDIVIDMAKLGKICAKYISRNQLETLAGGVKYAGLMIDIRTDINGNTLEVGFFTDQNSILTLNQLEMIEKEITLTKLVSMKPEILPLLEGSNFWLVWPKIDFEDMLKIKLKMEAPNQKENN